MRNRRRNRRIVGGDVLVLTETTADRLVGSGKGAVIAYDGDTCRSVRGATWAGGCIKGTAGEQRTIKGNSRGAHEVTVGLKGRHVDNTAGKRRSCKGMQVLKKVNSTVSPSSGLTKRFKACLEIVAVTAMRPPKMSPRTG